MIVQEHDERSDSGLLDDLFLKKEWSHCSGKRKMHYLIRKGFFWIIGTKCRDVEVKWRDKGTQRVLLSMITENNQIEVADHTMAYSYANDPETDK